MVEIIKVLPPPPPSAIASFDATDLEEGTGVVNYQGANSKADTTLSYYLARDLLASNEINTQAATTGTSPTFARNLDIDFDILFNFPKTVKGFAKGNITLGGRSTSAAPNAWEMYAIIILKKNDVEIARVQTETISNGSGAINVLKSKVLNFEINATTRTHFKRGETLRVTVEIWSFDSGSTNTGFAHDPADRADEAAADGGIIEATDTTSFKINIPFEIST